MHDYNDDVQPCHHITGATYLPSRVSRLYVDFFGHVDALKVKPFAADFLRCEVPVFFDLVKRQFRVQHL